MVLGIFVIIFSIIYISFGLSTDLTNLVNYPTTNISEDLIIYVFLNVHNPPDTTQNNFINCGKINKYGLQAAEAAFMAVNSINENPNILPGVKLRLQILDVCKSIQKVIKESLKITYWRYMRLSKTLSNTYEVDKDVRTILGVLGPYDHYQAVMYMQNLLQLIGIPQIANLALPPNWLKSYWTNSTMSKKSSQLHAIVDVIIKFGWTYISIIDDGIIHGPQEIKYLQALMLKQGICVHKLEKLKSLVPSHLEFVNLMKNLNEKNNLTNVVLCLCNGQIASGLLNTVKTLKLTKSFTFITSEDWSLYEEDFVGLEEELEGSLSLRAHHDPFPEFDLNYCNLLNSTNLSGQRKIWVKEIRQDLLEKKKFKNPEIFTLCDKNYKQTHEVNIVTRSIYALANTLHSMVHLKCGNANKICPSFWTIPKKKFIMNLARKLQASKYTDSKYKILNYQKNFHTYKLIGTWDNGLINLSKSVIFREKNIISICSAPCPPGHYMIKKYGESSEKCCWNCQPCPHNTIVSNDKFSCENCSINYRTNENNTKCIPLPITYTFWDSPLGIAIVILSVSGIITVFITVFLFIKNLETPVVKSSSPPISFLMLVGILSIFISAYGFVGEPTIEKCSLTRFSPQIGSFIIFFGLLIKTIRIVTLLGMKKAAFPKTKHKYLSTKFLLSIMACFLILRITILVLFYVYFSIEIITDAQLSDNIAERYCTVPKVCVYTDVGINTVLIVLCTIYAIRGRNIPTNFNESKYIVFAMYIIVISQSAVIVQVYTANAKTRYEGLGLMLNAWIHLIFLFFPKLYTIIFDPANNNSAVFIASLEGISPFNRKPSESPLVKFLQGYVHFIRPEYTPSVRMIGIQVGERIIDDITFTETNDHSSEELSSKSTSTNLYGDLVIQNPAYTRKIQNVGNKTDEDKLAEIANNGEIYSTNL